MATMSDGVFRFLSLCTQPPGSAAVAQRLPSALTAVPSLDELATAAEQHGLEPLVLAHIERTGLAIPENLLRARLLARWTQHAHAASVRARVMADVTRATVQARVPFLVLKGAALAHLVYDDPRLRPMRDVDLLIRKADAGRALDVLMHCGFRPGGTAPSHHHHLQSMAKTLEGATVTIELHHELMARTPFVEPRNYDDLIRRSQSFEWGGMSYQTLGCEDTLWHVYAHAFVINALHPGAIRLLSVADLVHATEEWIDRIDWARLRRQYGRLPRALHVLHDLVPWSPHVAEVLREQVERPATAVRTCPIDSDPHWSAALIPDVLWPPEWWFRMRYGITAWPRWVWFRVLGHPAHLALSAGRAVMTRLPRWFGLHRTHAGQV
jgi:hypothetical protein